MSNSSQSVYVQAVENKVMQSTQNKSFFCLDG